MNCSQARRLLSDQCNRPPEVPRPPVAVALGAHLRTCADCARFDRLLREGMEGVRALPVVAPDPRGRAALRARLVQRQAESGRVSWGSAWVPIALLLLTVVAMATAALLRPDASGPANATPRPAPLTLRPDEAVDLARFSGYHTSIGDISGVPVATAAYVVDLPSGQANAMIKGDLAASAPPSPSGSPIYEQSRVLFVVVHGTVMEAETPLGNGLAMIFGYDGKLRAAAVGTPWDTAIPPGARAMPLRDAPKLDDVSWARAQSHFSNPNYKLPRVPAGLALTRIDIREAGEIVDPGPIPISFNYVSITLTYADTTGRPRLWLTQTAANAKFTSPPSAIPWPDDGQVYYADAGEQQPVGVAWQRNDPWGGRWLWLSAASSSDLIEAMTNQPGLPYPETPPPAPTPFRLPATPYNPTEPGRNLGTPE